SPILSSRLLALSSLAASAGAETSVISFSINENPTTNALEAFRSLPASVRLCARDPLSHERLANHLLRPVSLTADIAFLLKPIRDSVTVTPVLEWIAEQKDAGRLVVGINANRQVLGAAPQETLAMFIDAYSQALDELYALEKVSYLLIAHDFRGSDNDQVLAEVILARMAPEVRVHTRLTPVPCKAAEIKGICADLDFVLTARMHCAIACLGQTTPVAGIGYQDKFEGLFLHFGLGGMVMTPEQALQPGSLLDMLLKLMRERDALRVQIAAELPRILALAEDNVA
ncbi:MAG: hypothetical protein GX601_19995, partial [Anaerolineales bacterium]|nr:hypothetical protein [Anaerolineales bacterium]